MILFKKGKSSYYNTLSELSTPVITLHIRSIKNKNDTKIGKKCLIASQTGIAGCVTIEDEVTLWGQVGTNSGITIGKGAVILGQTGVTKSIPGGKTYFGTPISESREKLKELAYLKRLMREEKKR